MSLSYSFTATFSDAAMQQAAHEPDGTDHELSLIHI